MRAHGNVVPRQVFDDFDLVGTAFELGHHRATFLHQPDRIVERLVRARVTHERHVGYQKRTA